MRIPSLAIVCALAVMAVVPTVQGQELGIKNPNVSTPTDMFFHLVNIQDFPINTQIPDDKWTQSVTYGSGTSTLTCVDQATGQSNTGGIGNEYHTFRGFSSPSYVEYDVIENGAPRLHPERGISYDAIIDPTAPFVVYWYLKTGNQIPTAGETLDPTVPVVIPEIIVKATMRAGDAISIDDKAYDSGPLLAKGQTNPVILLPSANNGPGPQTSPAPGAHPQVRQVTSEPGFVYEFAVPMKLETDKIPRATGYNLRIDVYINNPKCNDPAAGNGAGGSFMPNFVSIYSGKSARPRMDLSIMNPIRLEYLHPQFVGDDMVIHTSMNSAWGNYDVHEETIAVSITGPSAATSLVKAAIVQRTHEHYHHQEAVDVTYVWQYKTDKAANGPYVVTVQFANDQLNAVASGVASFELGKGIVIGCGGIQESAQKLANDCSPDVQRDGVSGTQKSPGIELLGILGVLGVAMALLRRRQA